MEIDYAYAAKKSFGQFECKKTDIWIPMKMLTQKKITNEEKNKDVFVVKRRIKMS